MFAIYINHDLFNCIIYSTGNFNLGEALRTRNEALEKETKEKAVLYERTNKYLEKSKRTNRLLVKRLIRYVLKSL